MNDSSHIQDMRTVYNQIAQEFSETRKHGWQEWKLFEEYIPQSGKILDIGCGNGRLSEYFPQYEYYGIDLADEFIKIAQKRYPNKQFIQAEMTHLPFEDNFFDSVFSIASLHHVNTKELRLQALSEMHRVLKKDHHLCIMVWNLRNNQRYAKELAAAKKTHSEFDLLIPWGDKKIMRYYYAYSADELQQQLTEAGFSVVKTSSDRNITCIAKKQ